MKDMRRLRFAVMTSATVVLLAAVRTTAFAQTLVIETADASGGVGGQFTSLALDALGRPHVSYKDAATGNLRYASKFDGVWTIETADASANNVGDFSSIALDAAGNPHVSYQDGTTDNLMYARKSDVWTIETADGSANLVGEYSSLALDVSGNPHVSYQDLTTRDLKYARKSGGVWTRETADASPNNVGGYASLALDASGNPHVSYQDFTTLRLKYARKSGGAWTIETADGSVNVGASFTSIAVDAAGNPQVSYYDQALNDLKYARKSGGLWIIEGVDGSANAVGLHTSLALDATGNPHVSYMDNTTGDLKYARKSGGIWAIETFDASANVVGLHTSLALDATGNPHVSYQDNTSAHLKYAYIPSAIITSPPPGVTWAVGSRQTIRWYFTGGLAFGNSDVYVSVDAGSSYSLIRDGGRDPYVTLRVPHTPTRYASVKVIRPSPYIEAHLDSFFTIDGAITLNNFDARVIGNSNPAVTGGIGVALSWETTPGREADIRYRVERAAAGDAASPVFTPLHSEPLSTTDFFDTSGGSATAVARYRLTAINGLSEEFVLGETSVGDVSAPDVDLLAMPNTSRTGEIVLRFRVESSRLETEVALFDVSGRRVRVLASGSIPPGVRDVAWDGRDDRGERVSAGVYFARLSWGGAPRATERVTVVR